MIKLITIKTDMSMIQTRNVQMAMKIKNMNTTWAESYVELDETRRKEHR